MNGVNFSAYLSKLEERKKELIAKIYSFKERDIVNCIVQEINSFKSEGNDRIFIFYGLRGIGKSTAIYQVLSKFKDILFIEGNDLKNKNIDLLELIDFYKINSENRIVIIDELTDIDGWGDKLKILHDLEGIKVIATGSSAIKISKNSARVLRRAYFKRLIPLSFKEFLKIKYDINIDLNKEIVNLLSSEPNDAYIKATALFKQIKEKDYNILAHFNDYLKAGFPLNLNKGFDIETISKQLVSLVSTIDFSEISGFDIETIDKAKNLSYQIAYNKSGESSFQNLGNSVKVNQTTVGKIITAFETADLLIKVYNNKESATKYRKEAKLLFSSPAVRFGLLKSMYETEDIGSLREDSFVTHMIYNDIKVEYVSGLKKTPDYVISCNGKKSVVEIGGPSKKSNQLSKGFIVIDDDKVDLKEGVCYIPLYLVCLI